MKTKKIVSTVLATAMATAMVLTGCGNSNQAPAASADAGSQPAQTQTSSDSGSGGEYISPMHSGVTRRRLQQLRRWLTSSTVSRIESK